MMLPTRLSVLAVALPAFACAGGPPTQADDTKMKVSDDRAVLARNINIPDGLSRVRWASRPRGAGGFVGPTDLELVAFFPLDAAAWSEVQPLLGTPTGAKGSNIPADLLQAVHPGTTPTNLRTPTAVEGEVLPTDAFENVFWKGVAAIHTSDGLLVYLVNR